MLSNFCLLVPLLPFKPHIIVLFSPLIYFSILFPNYIYTFFHLCLGVWGCIIRGFQLRRCYSAQHGWVSHQSRDFSTRQSLVRNLLRNMAEIGRGQRSEYGFHKTILQGCLPPRWSWLKVVCSYSLPCDI